METSQGISISLVETLGRPSNPALKDPGKLTKARCDFPHNVGPNYTENHDDPTIAKTPMRKSFPKVISRWEAFGAEEPGCNFTPHFVTVDLLAKYLAYHHGVTLTRGFRAT
jgi:hypothetical protein